MTYLEMKLLHQVLLALSVAGFIVRASAALLQARWVGHRLARTLPHLVDTALLASGVWLGFALRLWTAPPGWLVAKLCGLVLYIGLGAVVMRPSLRPQVRACALVLAVSTVTWMVSVARTKNAMGALAPLLS